MRSPLKKSSDFVKAYTLAEKMVLWRAINGVNGDFQRGIPKEFLHAALTVNTEANKALEALTLVAPNESEARCALAGLCKWAVQLGFFEKKTPGFLR